MDIIEQVSKMQQEHEELKEERDALARRVKSLEATSISPQELEHYQLENTKLRMELNKYERDIRFEKDLKKLQREHLNLKGRYDRLQDKYDRIHHIIKEK